MKANSISEQTETQTHGQGAGANAPRLRCCRCGEPITARTAVHTALGYACPTCSRPNPNIVRVNRGSLNAARDMRHGALWFFGGLAVTAISYAMSSGSGGVFIMAWGAIAYGLLLFVRGLLNR